MRGTPPPTLVIGQPSRTRRFYSSNFPHPISHRTPHYRVGNDRIGWLVISQKRLNFWTKRNCTIQGKMGCNGLGNRCSILLSYGTVRRDLAQAGAPRTGY